jgi:hypothetical protein
VTLRSSASRKASTLLSARPAPAARVLEDRDLERELEELDRERALDARLLPLALRLPALDLRLLEPDLRLLPPLDRFAVDLREPPLREPDLPELAAIPVSSWESCSGWAQDYLIIAGPA